MNIYLELTTAFNEGRTRAIISSGQAVVLHRLAIMSKDGDWILREDPEATAHVIRVLERHGASYRFGAPLDIRWLAGGWSAHFEFTHPPLRVRTDFVTRPPRLTTAELAGLWEAQDQDKAPVVDIRRLIAIKKTNREKDYAVIGELARQLTNSHDQLLASRSATDLQALARAHPDLVAALAAERPLLATIASGRATLEAALDAERRQDMHANEDRLARYNTAAARWREHWPTVEKQIRGLGLTQAHLHLAQCAEGVLPFEP